MHNVPMVNLQAQYQDIKEELNRNIQNLLSGGQFIGGHMITKLEERLAEFNGVSHVISCANGTDALMLALMALDLKPGDEVITQAFGYIAAAEVIALLGLKPLFADVHKDSFELKLKQLESQISERTKVIIPMHLFGQCSNMDALCCFAEKHKLALIEDNAQSIGSGFMGKKYSGLSGSFGDMSTLSFFPSKNLGCYGDGGALMTNNSDYARKLRQLRSHGQSKKYYHSYIGLNSRLDTLQAGILDVKMNYLDSYNAHRIKAAAYYESRLSEFDQIILPLKKENRKHVYHQFTLRILNGHRDGLMSFLNNCGISTAIYYPLPIYKQEAYKQFVSSDFKLENTEQLCQEVLSLPIHSHISESELEYICVQISNYFKN